MLLRSIRSQLLGLVIATVVPFTALIGVGLWSQWQSDQAAAIRRAINDARLLAAQVDDYIGNLDSLLIGLSQAVSPDPADARTNDALLQRVRRELPNVVTNVFLFSLDGDQIGTSADGVRANVRDRDYFRRILAGQRLSISEVIRGRMSGQWVFTLARPVEDEAGKLRAVIAVGTRLEHFQDTLRVQGLPEDSVVRIVNEKGIVIARSVDGPGWIGRDLSTSEAVARHLAAREISELVRWPDGVERITGSATAHTVPWLVSVGLPKEVAFAAVATPARLGRALHRRHAGRCLRHRLDAVRAHRSSVATARQGRDRARGRRPQPPQCGPHPRRGGSARRQLQSDGGIARATRGRGPLRR